MIFCEETEADSDLKDGKREFGAVSVGGWSRNCVGACEIEQNGDLW